MCEKVIIMQSFVDYLCFVACFIPEPELLESHEARERNWVVRLLFSLQPIGMWGSSSEHAITIGDDVDDHEGADPADLG